MMAITEPSEFICDWETTSSIGEMTLVVLLVTKAIAGILEVCLCLEGATEELCSDTPLRLVVEKSFESALIP